MATAATSSQAPSIHIIGAGIAGLASALALTKYLPHPPPIIVSEIRSAPSTTGGAVNLTPNALRCLHHLGALSIIEERHLGHPVISIDLLRIDTGATVGHVDYSGPAGTGFGDPPFMARRILRADLLAALRAAAARLPNISVRYGAQLTAIAVDDAPTTAIPSSANPPRITLSFADGHSARAALLLGCDGIHSAVRTQSVAPHRTPQYTGVAVALGFAPRPADAAPLPFAASAMYFGRRGSLMVSFFDEARAAVYVGAVMETPAVRDRGGWAARGADRAAVRADVMERFAGGAVEGAAVAPGVREVLEAADDWFLYPICSLAGGGEWAAGGGRVVLLGDAAHAMPPQGESAGLALEDAILYARMLGREMAREGRAEVLMQQQEQGQRQERIREEDGGGFEAATVKAAFEAYERRRRPVIDTAYADAVRRWETVKDLGWLTYTLKTMLTSWFLWWTAAARHRAFEEDVATMELD